MRRGAELGPSVEPGMASSAVMWARSPITKVWPGTVTLVHSVAATLSPGKVWVVKAMAVTASALGQPAWITSGLVTLAAVTMDPSPTARRIWPSLSVTVTSALVIE